MEKNQKNGGEGKVNRMLSLNLFLKLMSLKHVAHYVQLLPVSQVKSCIVLQVINYLMFFMFVEFFPLLLGKVPAFKWI